MQLYGRDWAKLAAAVPSKTLTQIKNYYQNYKVKVRAPRACLSLSPIRLSGCSHMTTGGHPLLLHFERHAECSWDSFCPGMNLQGPSLSMQTAIFAAYPF